MKTCSKCNTKKQLSEFYYRKDRNKYRNDCIKCFKQEKATREAVPGVKAERAKKERIRRKTHKDRINKTLSEQRNDPKMRNSINARNMRYTDKRKAVIKDGISTLELKTFIKEHAGFCSYCFKQTTKVLTIDHITPISKGGTHTVDNLAISCKSCNSSKYSTTLIIWMAIKQQDKM